MATNFSELLARLARQPPRNQHGTGGFAPSFPPREPFQRPGPQGPGLAFERGMEAVERRLAQEALLRRRIAPGGPTEFVEEGGDSDRGPDSGNPLDRDVAFGLPGKIDDLASSTRPEDVISNIAQLGLPSSRLGGALGIPNIFDALANAKEAQSFLDLGSDLGFGNPGFDPEFDSFTASEPDPETPSFDFDFDETGSLAPDDFDDEADFGGGDDDFDEGGPGDEGGDEF